MPKSSTNGIAKSSPPNSILTNHLRSERDDSFLTGGGEMGQLMRTFDWSKTTVGPTENWPQSLRTAISMILNSSLPTFIWWGQDDLTNFYNDAYIRVLGNKHPQALGKSGRDVWQEIWNEAQLVVMHIFTTGQSIYKENLPVTIIRHNKPEQACFTYSFNPIRDESGRVGGIYCICVETTAQVQSQNLIKASDDRYKAFIANSSEGIWRIELEQPVPIGLDATKQIDLFYIHGYLAECNNTMAHMYGFSKASDIVGARLGDLLIKEDQGNIEYLTAFIQSGYRLTGVESHEKDAEGNDKYFSNSLVGIVEDGHMTRAWGVQQDVSERKALENQKDEFIGIASHELKTPVTSLKAYTQSLHKRVLKEGNLKTAEQLAKMDRQLDKLTTLISHLLDVTKIESGKLELKQEPFDINELVKDVVNGIQQTTRHHHITLHLAPTRQLFADRDRVGQVITNVLANAIKYSSHGQTITVTTNVAKGTFTLCVKDKGIGIPPEEQKHVFDRFYRVEDPSNPSTYAGLGLGLYISAEIIKQLGGTIWIESQVGQGSTVCFSLPLKKP